MTLTGVQRATLAIGSTLGEIVSRKMGRQPGSGSLLRRRRRIGPILEALESRIALTASATAGLVHAVVETPPVQSPRLEKIERVAAAAYVWGLPTEFMYRFANYNELVTAPVNTLAYSQEPAAWNNAATNAGDSSVLYINGQLDLTRASLVYTIPATNADYQVTQIFDNFINVVADPGTRTVPTNSATSYLIVGPNSPYAHDKSVELQGFTFPVITLDTNRGEMLVRLLADTLAPGNSSTSVQNTFNNLATQFTLNTLQQFQANGNKPVAPQSYDEMTPTAEQLQQAQKWQNTPTNAVAFFKQVGQSLRLNPLPGRTTGIAGTPLAKVPAYLAPQANARRVYFAPSAGQRTTLALFRSIGLTPKGFKIPKGWGPAELKALQQGFENGAGDIQAKLQAPPTSATNYWSYINHDFGTYPNTLTGYQYRAVGVIAGGFPNLPIDGLYAPIFTNSSALTPLDGNNTYSVTFTLPQASYSSYPVTGIEPPLALNSSGSPIGFWSLTLYQPDSSEAAAPFLSQASVLNTAYSTASTPVVSIDTSADTITVPASNLGPLKASTAIMFGAGVSTYGLTPNVPYYIASTPVLSGGNYTFQISTQWKQALSSSGAPIQYSGGPGAIVALSTPLSAGTPLDYGVIQPVSQLGSTEIADGQLKANDGSVPGFPAGSYTIWLSPTLPNGVPATNWIPTPSTAYLQSIYGDSVALSTTIEPMMRMYDAQPGNLPPSILPLPPGGVYPQGLPSSYLFPLLVQAQ
jgi:hypothetical protein